MPYKLIINIETVLPCYSITNHGLICVSNPEVVEINNDLRSTNKQFDFSSKGYEEGVGQILIELGRYRNPKLRKEAIEKNGGYRCFVCGSNYQDVYGDLGKSVVEIHHIIPIYKGERITTEEEIVVVCANCHRVIHSKGKEPLTIDTLKQIIERARSVQNKNES